MSTCRSGTVPARMQLAVEALTVPVEARRAVRATTGTSSSKVWRPSSWDRAAVELPGPGSRLSALWPRIMERSMLRDGDLFFFAFVWPWSQSINQRYLGEFPLGAEDPRWFKLNGILQQGRRLRKDAPPNELERCRANAARTRPLTVEHLQQTHLRETRINSALNAPLYAWPCQPVGNALPLGQSWASVAAFSTPPATAARLPLADSPTVLQCRTGPAMATRPACSRQTLQYSGLATRRASPGSLALELANWWLCSGGVGRGELTLPPRILCSSNNIAALRASGDLICQQKMGHWTTTAAATLLD